MNQVKTKVCIKMKNIEHHGNVSKSKTKDLIERFNHAIEIAELEPQTPLKEAEIAGMKAQRDDLKKQLIETH